MKGPEDWLRTMSASKIAAVVGLSPFKSRYALWVQMAGIVVESSNDAKRRGHYLEEGIRQWFADQHLEWSINPKSAPAPDHFATLPDGAVNPVWVDKQDARFTASPDGWVGLPDGSLHLLEVKTDGGEGEWGTPGTDEIPPGYMCQVQWQMSVCGADVAHVAVLLPFLRFAEYVVHANPDDQAYLRREALAFLDSLERDERPDIDAHGATYEAIRKEHPEIDGEVIGITRSLAQDYLTSCIRLRDAKAIADLYKNELLAVMGDAREARCEGERIAIRKPGRGGSVSLVPTLPKTEKAEAA